MSSIPSKSLARWVSQLVQIPSVTPTQSGGIPNQTGENRIATEVGNWFREFGGKVFLEEVADKRPNVYGVWQGRTDKWVAVDIHLDTVGVTQMTAEPFSGKIQNNRVYGRGAADTKATLGIMLAILEEVNKKQIELTPNLIVVGTADEEVDGLGAPAFVDWLHKQHIHLNQLLVAEPTSCRPTYGHKGEVRLSFTVHGKSAHSSKPDQGKNAITAAAGLILGFESEHRELKKNLQSLPLGPATLAVTLIEGGSGLNVIPDSCCVSIDRRTLPGEDSNQIIHSLTKLAKESCSLEVSTKLLSNLDAFYQSPESNLIKNLADWSNLEPGIVTFGTNAWAYNGLADECVVIGPGSIAQAHGQEEWISVSELEKMCSILVKWLELPFR